jgi:hypothetical protein
MNFWDSELQIGEQIYNLSHLKPFYFDVVLEGFAAAVRVSVTFHNHCFTDSTLEIQSQDALQPPFVSKKEGADKNRFFSFQRCALSKELPNILKKFIDIKVAQTRFGDFVVITTQAGNSYGVFFNLRRFDKTTCDLMVLSAYPLRAGKNPAVTKHMSFKVAVAKVMQRKTLHFPQ